MRQQLVQKVSQLLEKLFENFSQLVDNIQKVSQVLRDKKFLVTGGLVGLEQELFLCTHLSFNKLIILIKLVAVRSKYLAKTGLAVLDVLIL